MSQSKVASKAYYPALTGIRAIAAYLVFFHHFNPFSWKDHPATTSTGELCGAIVEQWHVGVTVFFVLSGFLIATRYLDRITLSRAWAKQYMLNRFARIYPLYFLLTIIAFTAMQFWPSRAPYEWQSNVTVIDKAASLLTNLTLTRAFFHSFLFIGVPTAWSLTVEECFYISAPFLLLLLHKRAHLLPWTTIALLSIGLLLTLIATRLDVYGSFMRPLSFVLNYTYFGRCTEFMLGIGLALWVKQRGHGPAKRGTTWSGLGVCLAALAGMVITSWNYEATVAWPTPFSSTLTNNFLLPVGVIILFNGLIHERTWFRHLLETQFLDLLGKSSYAFYLIHLGLWSDLLQQVVGRNIPVLFLVLNVAAIGLYKLVEHPLHTFIVSRYRRQLTREELTMQAA